MKMISFEEYDALKAYMEPKLFELWQHENEVRKEKGLEELNYFQIGFPITEVYHYYVEGDHNFYIVFNVSCHRLLQEGTSPMKAEISQSEKMYMICLI